MNLRVLVLLVVARSLAAPGGAAQFQEISANSVRTAAGAARGAFDLIP